MSCVRYLFGLIAFAALFLFIFIVNTKPVFASTTYYVDDNCPGPNYNGTVNDPFCSIQSGINTALAGDTVQVSAGTYNELIIMKNGVILKGAGAGDNPSVNSIIDGGDTGTVITTNNIDSTSRLDGFFITGGHGKFGGGMYNKDSSLQITNCIFSGNSTDLEGAGMSNDNSFPNLINCRFINNIANYIGGGMFNYNNSSPTLLNCEFISNAASVDSGGGMANSIASPILINCIFSGNTASQVGGAISNLLSSPVLINCTFSGNSVVNIGGGIYNEVNSHPTVINSILWGNTPDGISSDEESGLAATYSNIQGGYSGTGNINTDPMFVDSTHGDFHLKQNSPCIDAGDNSAPYLSEKDIDGDNRKVNNPSVTDTGNGSSPVIDMGADEYNDERCDEFPWELFYPAFMKKRNRVTL